MNAVRLALLTVLALQIAAPARADMAASAACAAKLGPQTFKICQEAGPSLKPDTSISDLLRNVVRPMVISGKLGMTEAKQAAETAGLCLKAHFG